MMISVGNIGVVGAAGRRRNAPRSWSYPGGAFTFARNSKALYQDADGDWVEAATDELRIDADGNLLLEPGSTNYIRDSAWSGVVSGGTTFGTYWSSFPSSMTRLIAGKGVEYGLPYIDLKYTSTGAGNHNLRDAQASIATVAQGDVMTGSLFARIVGGSKTNISQISLTVSGHNSADSQLESEVLQFLANIDSTMKRFQVTRTFSNASTVKSRVQTAVVATGACDITIRYYGVQGEIGPSASSPILTSGAAAARADDLFTPTLPSPGTHDMVITHDDLSQTTIPDVTAPFTIDPSTLDRPLVSSIDWRSV